MSTAETIAVPAPPPGTAAPSAPNRPVPPRKPFPDPIDEASRRRPDFGGGRPVVLADGQEWTLFKPRIRFRPSDGDEGFTVFLDPDDGRFEEMLSQWRDNDGGPLVVQAEMSMALAVLLRNYNLSTEEAGRLLQFSYSSEEEDPEGNRIRSEAMDVVLGIGPKPPGGISASPPS